MKLVPVPFDDLRETSPLWIPFLREISKKSGEPLKDLVGYVANRHIRIMLIFENDKPIALVGLKLWQCGADLVGDIVWGSGKNRKLWQTLLPEYETLLKQMGCTKIRAIGGLGWSPFLKKHGYKIYHVIMEKKL